MRKKILIADDEADIVSMLRAFFESKGYFVLSAVNGTEALKQVEQEPICASKVRLASRRKCAVTLASSSIREKGLTI